MKDDLSPDELQAQAFQAAKEGYMLFGVHYDYPTTGRIRAADAMGKTWPAIGEQGAERCAASGKYPGMLTDIIITLWLATIKHASELTAEEVKAGKMTMERASLTPQQALQQAVTWAELNGIALNDGEAYGEAYTVYWQIIAHDRNVAFKLDVTPKTPESDSSPLV